MGREDAFEPDLQSNTTLGRDVPVALPTPLVPRCVTLPKKDQTAVVAFSFGRVRRTDPPAR